MLEWRGFKFRSGFCPLQSSHPRPNRQTSKSVTVRYQSLTPPGDGGRRWQGLKAAGARGCCLVLETARPRAGCWVSGSANVLSTGWGARPTAPPRGLLLQGGRTSHWFQGSWVFQQQPHQDWQCNRLGTTRRWGRIKAFLRGRSAQGCSFVSLASPRQ